MENEENGCSQLVLMILGAIIVLAVIGLIAFLGGAKVTVSYRPIVRVQPTPNLIHQMILETARTDNEIKLAQARHEMRREWAWIAAPWAIIGLGVTCFIMAFKRWVRGEL